MRLYLFVLFFISGFTSAAASDSVKYERNFSFKEGIYLNFWQFRNNAPIPSGAIISDYNENDKDFLLKVLSRNSISYKDSSGAEMRIKVNDLWGYSLNREVYKRTINSFSRIQIIGSLCHFLGVVENYSMLHNNVYRDPIRQPVYEAEQEIDMKTGSVFHFNLNNITEILKQDPELYNEFMKLKKKKRKNSIFIFLQKYNTRHPLYFPQ